MTKTLTHARANAEVVVDCEVGSSAKAKFLDGGREGWRRWLGEQGV